MFRITEQPIDPSALGREASAAHAGAFVSFEGWVRDHHQGRAVDSLEYEAYAVLAEKEGARILAEARERFGVAYAGAVHRVGHLGIGEVAVWVGVSAAHRGPAFEACRYVIDEVKRRVPIWKREYYTDGASAWVGCAGCASHAP